MKDARVEETSWNQFTDGSTRFLFRRKKTKKKEIRPFYKPDVINMLVLTFLHVPRGEKCGWGETEGEPLTYD